MYKHTQVGHLTLGALLAAVAFVVGLVTTTHAPPSLLWAAVPGLLIVGMLFGTLTTQVDRERFTFWFGPGVMRRSFQLSEIASCTTVTNPWWYGWGIHWTPDGWVYNVAGTQAVQLVLRDGRRLRVGTDEGDELCRWIHAGAGRGGA